MNEFLTEQSSRRELQSSVGTHPKEASVLGQPQTFGAKLFLTQESKSRETSSLSSHALTHDLQPADEFDEDDEENEPIKPDVEEIKRMLYKRECTKLGVTPVGKFLRSAASPNLSIRYYNLGCEGARALSVPLMLDATITTLDLEGNDIGYKGLAAMAEMLGEHCTLTTLNLRRNSLGSRGAAIMSKVILKMGQLSSLNLAANDFYDKDGQVFAQMLKENKHLKSLDLSDNSLGEDSGKALGDAMAQNETLEEIDLQWNKISGRGASKLLNGIKENVSLKRLNLSFNSISRGSSKALGNPLMETLACNSTLQHIDLTGCNLVDFDIISVAKGLKDNDTLTTLKIGQNLVQVQSMTILLKTLVASESSGITLLDLAESVIEEKSLEDIEVLESRGAKVQHGMVHQSETDFHSDVKQRKSETSGSVGDDGGIDNETEDTEETEETT